MTKVWRYVVRQSGALVIGTILASSVLAAEPEPQVAGEYDGHEMSSHGSMAADAGANPSTAAFEASNARMHEAMAIEYTGNTDVDFVRGMIGHHQGAIDMARIELEYGSDPEIRKLAEEIIRAQEGEIFFMHTWLSEHAPQQ